VDEADLEAHMKVVIGQNRLPKESIEKLEVLYRAAWKRVCGSMAQ
jgi:hypothetical protein